MGESLTQMSIKSLLQNYQNLGLENISQDHSILHLIQTHRPTHWLTKLSMDLHQNKKFSIAFLVL